MVQPICIPCNYEPLGGIRAAAKVRDLAEAELLAAIREYVKIAENMRNVWMHQADGAE